MTFEDFKQELPSIISHSKGYQIEYNLPILSGKWKKKDADLAIINRDSAEHQNFALLICTSKSEQCPIDRTYAKKIVRRMVEEYSFWIGLVWDSGKILKFNPSMKRNGEWEEIVPQVLAVELSSFTQTSIPTDYILYANNALNSYKGSASEKRIAKVVANWLGDFNSNQLTLQNRTISVSLVDQFRLLTLVLKEEKMPVSYKFCRYSSMSALKRILLEEHESMCGLAGMNDKSEGFFLDKCLTGNSFNLATKPPHVVDQYNEIFILSLCDESKSDDLTMWRLYGNDCKGVCLHYDINAEALRQSTEFFLMPVCYGNSNNPIVLLFKVLARLPYILGFKFGLTHKYIWQYFVKPNDFKVEEEFRLLYKPNNQNDQVNPKLKWIYNDGYGIFHPLREFGSPLVDQSSIFPLQLKKVILGPKSSEADINEVQLKSFIRTSSQYSSVNLDISVSKIDFYR